ncbi:hypothetical protein N656DRAFT_773483 [Canariomyces notabilis]|uniref:Uncharacterized protein n=1 Tax=Canariomyces notabilis TaxID=2074819 RepID=A0AAN6YYF5_9PEZI|nr:hypothetical protein N656DRAFT_773483 [Canariomyces arenarius]
MGGPRPARFSWLPPWHGTGVTHPLAAQIQGIWRRPCATATATRNDAPASAARN